MDQRQCSRGCLVLPLFWLAATLAYAEPYRPNDDDHVVERLPASIELERKALALMRRQATDANDLSAALRLAQHYLALGRAEGDPRYYGRRPWHPGGRQPSRRQTQGCCALSSVRRATIFQPRWPTSKRC